MGKHGVRGELVCAGCGVTFERTPGYVAKYQRMGNAHDGTLGWMAGSKS